MSPSPVLPGSGPAGLFTPLPPRMHRAQPGGCRGPLLLRGREQARHRRGLDMEVWRREFWSQRP